MTVPAHLEAASCRRHRRTHERSLARAAMWTLLLAGSLSVGAAAVTARDLVPITMHPGFTPQAFLQSNRNDVEAALKALAESIGRERGFLVAVKTRSFANVDTLHEAIAAGEVNVAVFDALAYVAGPHPGDLTPVFIPSSKGPLGRSYLVLVRRDSGLRTLEDLRGKSIVELQAPDLSVGHTWLLNLLLPQGAATHEGFFGSIEYVDKPTAAVLPVFFGNRDACLVDELAFNLMAELNPQVGAVLESIATSVPLVGAVVCVSESNWSSPDFRPAFLKALGELHLVPAGRQVLDLFKMDHLAPFRESDLATVRELWSSYTKQRTEVRP